MSQVASASHAPSDPIFVEIVTIGDELNRGEIVDTNSSWLAAELTALGAYVRWRSSVTDQHDDMRQALELASGRAQWVVCSGGLGPTEDDRTVDVVANWLRLSVTSDADHEARLRERYRARDKIPSANSLRQVRIPVGAQVLANRTGIAPGFVVKQGASELFFMPGVPSEMKPMFHEQIVPRLSDQFEHFAKTAKRAWRVAGLAESQIDEALQGVLATTDDATLHFRLIYPECLVTVVVRRPTQAEADAVLAEISPTIQARLGIHAYGNEHDSLAGAIGTLLRSRGQTLALAESCTGGLMSELVTAVPGSSHYFRGAAVTYANSVKHEILGVSEQSLAEHGAVSELVAREMAEGVSQKWRSDFAVAITGIAGPDGGSQDKPVGTVWLALAVAGKAVHSKKLFWPGSRDQVRLVAAHSALFLLWKLLHESI